MNNIHEDFNKFEDSLNDKTINTDITYTQDRAIEADVKYRYLIEKFGKTEVDSAVDDFLVLSDYNNFLLIKNLLQSKLG